MSGNGTVWAVCSFIFAICLAVILALGYTRWDWNSDMGITPTSTKAALTSRVPARTSRAAARTTRAARTTKAAARTTRAAQTTKAAARTTRAAQTTRAPATTMAPATTAKVCKPGISASQMMNIGKSSLETLRAVGGCTGEGSGETKCCTGICATADDIKAGARMKGMTLPEDVILLLDSYGTICTNL